MIFNPALVLQLQITYVLSSCSVTSIINHAPSSSDGSQPTHVSSDNVYSDSNAIIASTIIVSSLLTNLVKSTTRLLTLAPDISMSVLLSFTVLHAHDMLPQLKTVVEEGRTAVVIIVDGVSDWTPASLLNFLLFFFPTFGGILVSTCSLSAHMLPDIWLMFQLSIHILR